MLAPTLQNLANGQQITSAVTAINSNNALITTALTNALDRQGSAPNQMQANLDMNSYSIINLAPPATIDSPVRLVDIATSAGLTPSAIVTLSGNNTLTGNNTFTKPVLFPNYTVAALPASPGKGAIACVTDLQSQIGPGILVSTVTGGGTVASIVFYNGSAWAGI